MKGHDDLLGNVSRLAFSLQRGCEPTLALSAQGVSLRWFQVRGKPGTIPSPSQSLPVPETPSLPFAGVGSLR